MNPDTNNQMVEPVTSAESVVKMPHPVNQVTTLSKYFAMVIFITLPFVGGYIGYRLAPEKVVEVQVPIVAPQLAPSVPAESPTITATDTSWLTATTSVDGVTFSLRYPSEIPIDIVRLSSGLVSDPFSDEMLPLSATSSIVFATVSDDRTHIFYVKHVGSQLETFVASIGDSSIRQLAAYPYVKMQNTDGVYDYSLLIPSFISTSTQSVVVYNVPLPNSQKVVGHILDYSQPQKEIVMGCQNDQFWGATASIDTKYIVWSCPDKNMYLSDWENTKLIIEATAKMQPVYPTIKNNRILFANSAEADEKLQAPKYSTALDGSDLKKENGTTYMGY